MDLFDFLDYYLKQTILFIVGIYFFFKGFIKLKKSRMIENVPTSTTRSLAMGLTELSGIAKEYLPMYSPLTNSSCCYYEYRIQQLRWVGKDRCWCTVAAGDSAEIPFLLSDDTGEVLVFPESAEVIFFCEKYDYITGKRKEIPAMISQFMDTLNIRKKSFWGKGTFRFAESYIIPNTSVYVLGCAQKGHSLMRESKADLDEKIDLLRNNARHKKEFDLDADGKVSAEEWNIAKNNIKLKMLEQFKMNNVRDIGDVIIAKGEAKAPYIISENKQDYLIDDLSGDAFLCIFGGAALSVLGIALIALVWIRNLK